MKKHGNLYNEKRMRLSHEDRHESLSLPLRCMLTPWQDAVFLSAGCIVGSSPRHHHHQRPKQQKSSVFSLERKELLVSKRNDSESLDLAVARPPDVVGGDAEPIKLCKAGLRSFSGESSFLGFCRDHPRHRSSPTSTFPICISLSK